MGLPFDPPAPFPALTLARLEGGPFALPEAWSAGPALIVLGHSDCPTTRLSLPFVDRLHRRRPRHVSVVAVLQDTPAAAAALRGEMGLDLPIVLEEEPYPVASALRLRTVPTLFVVGTDGRIARAAEGFRRDHLEAITREIGAEAPLFTPADAGPAHRPG